MRKIKKVIDIILITAAVAVVVVLANKIIPFKNLNASQNAEEGSYEEISDGNTDSEAGEKNLKLDMTIDENSRENNETEHEDSKDTGITITEDMGNIDFTKSEDFKIEVDLSRQVLTVFHKDDILKELICSGGAPESPTPPGEYITLEKIEYSWVDRFGVGAYYWIRFFEDYLIHSVPFDENGEMIEEEYQKLGSPASHGCIRLKYEEAKWLYETLPLGVKVVIY